MEHNLKKTFKICYVVGLILLFFSFFFDWYYYEIYNSNNKLIGFWGYNPLFGWHPVMKNKNMKQPKNLSIPIYLTFAYIILIIISTYIVLFKDFENIEKIPELKPYAIINILVLFFNAYYLIAFFVELYNTKLFFPFLYKENLDTGYSYNYYIGFGYLFQFIGFILIFSYTKYYYDTINKFEKEERTVEILTEKVLKKYAEPLDLDKLIAKQKMKLKDKIK